MADASPIINGTLIALYGLFPAFFSVAAGRRMDRIGFRKPILLGVACELLGLWLAAAFPSLFMLHVSAGLIGSGFMLHQIAIQNAVGYFGAPEDRAVNFSWLALGFSASLLLSPLITGYAIDQFGYRFTFIMLACLPIVPLIIYAADKLPLPQPPAPIDVGKRRLRDLVGAPKLRRVFFITTVSAMGWDLFSFVTPIYGASIGLSASRIGLIMSTFAAATLTVRLLMPLIIRRVPLWRVLMIAMLLAALVFAVMPLVKDVALLMVLAFVLGLGMGAAMPMIMSLIHSHSPPGRVGEALGLRVMLVNISQTGVPFMFGAVGAAIGAGPLFWVVAAVMAFGAWNARHEDRASRPKP